MNKIYYLYLILSFMHKFSYSQEVQVPCECQNLNKNEVNIIMLNKIICDSKQNAQQYYFNYVKDKQTLNSELQFCINALWFYDYSEVESLNDRLEFYKTPMKSKNKPKKYEEYGGTFWVRNEVVDCLEKIIGMIENDTTYTKVKNTKGKKNKEEVIDKAIVNTMSEYVRSKPPLQDEDQDEYLEVNKEHDNKNNDSDSGTKPSTPTAKNCELSQNELISFMSQGYYRDTIKFQKDGEISLDFQDIMQLCKINKILASSTISVNEVLLEGFASETGNMCENQSYANSRCYEVQRKILPDNYKYPVTIRSWGETTNKNLRAVVITVKFK